MLKKMFSLFLVGVVTLGLVSCSGSKNISLNTTKPAEENKGEKIKVVVTFNPVAEIARAIGKDKVQVETIVPEGTEPHDFEPKAKDLEAIYKSSIFVYNGLNIDSWAEKALKASDSKKVQILQITKECELIKLTNGKEKEKSDYDPHVWLSLKQAKNEGKNMKDALIKSDEKNKDYYEKNYDEFTKELDTLFNEYKPKFDKLKNKDFVTGHAAFSYFCRDFGLTQKSVENVFAEGEPTPKQLKELVEYCRANRVKTVFYEDLASPKVSETLAKEVNATTKKIYTIESKEDNKNYIEAMRANIQMVLEALS